MSEIIRKASFLIAPSALLILRCLAMHREFGG